MWKSFPCIWEGPLDLTMLWGLWDYSPHFTNMQTKPKALSGSPKIKLLESGWARLKNQLRSWGSKSRPSAHLTRWTTHPTTSWIGPSQILTLLLVYGIRSVGLFVSPGYIEYLPVGTRFTGMIVLIPHHHHYNGIGFFHENSTTLQEIFRKKKLTCNPPAFKHFHCCNEWVLTQSRWRAPTAVLANMQHGP